MEYSPFFRRPNYYYNQNRYTNPAMYKQRQDTLMAQKQEQKKQEEVQNEKIKETRKKEETDEPMFEILGIKLYFDDILIIALIFFLYTEGIEDNFLFISLILILLS